MRKLLILVAVVVLICSGCVDKKAAETDTPKQEIVQDSSDTQMQEADTQTDAPSQTDAAQPSPSESEEPVVGETEETLQELSGLLQELTEGDFADINYAE